MGDLRRRLVLGDQAMRDEALEHRRRRAGIPREVAERPPGPGLPSVVADVHQPEEQLPGDLLVAGVQRRVGVLRGPRDGIPYPAAGLVVGDGQAAAAAAGPGGKQGVGEQRQRPGLVPARLRGAGRAHIGQQHLDQAVLDAPARLVRGLYDHPAELLGGHGADHDLPFLQRPGQPRVTERVAVEVRAQAEHDQGVLGQGGQRGDELPPPGLVRSRGEDLLELIHDDRRWLVSPPGEPGVPSRVLAQPLRQQPGTQRSLGPGPGQRRQMPGQGRQRRGVRRDQHHRAAARPGRGAGPQPGDQASPQQ